MSTVGGGNAANTVNSGRIFVMLRAKPERKATALAGDRAAASHRRRRCRASTSSSSPSSRSTSRTTQTRAQYQFGMRSSNLAALREYAPLMEERMRRIPSITDVNSDLQVRARSTVDRCRPRHRLAPWPVGRPDPSVAVLGLRHPTGLDHLRSRRHLPGDPRGRSQIRRHQRGAAHASRCARRPAHWCRSIPWPSATTSRRRLPSTTSPSFPRSSSHSTWRPAWRSARRYVTIQAVAGEVGLPATSPPASRAAPRSSSRRWPTRACCCSPRCW